MIRPRLLKLPTKPLDANISLCPKCRDNVEALRDIFTRLCERAEVEAPTPLNLWPGAKATIATSTGRSKQGTTEASAPSQGPDVFAPPSPVASPSSPVSPSSSSSSPGITYSEKRVRLPNPGRVQLGRLQGQYNISGLGSTAAFNLFVPPIIGKGVSDTTAARCLFEMSEAAFFMMAEELSVVEDLTLGCDGLLTWFDRQGFEVHLSWKDKTELLGVVDLTAKGAGGYLEDILALFARLHAVQEAHGWQQTNFDRCAHCTPTMPP